MADEDKQNEGHENEEEKKEEGQQEDFGDFGSDEGGLGNLPPLSDFDSSEGDSNLPPLGSLDSDPGKDEGEEKAEEGEEGSSSGLPPLGDVSLDTPGDEQKEEKEPSTPGGFSDLDTPTGGLDTPEPSESFGFQDLAADSDFSPETPEIGPGPDSDLETPMFDSAFGGESGEFGGGESTPSPTQAMETPMFDDSPSPAGGGAEGFGFDQDAFGGAPQQAAPQGDEDIGTPIPDFSPDTGVPPQGAGPPQQPQPQRKAGITGILLSIGVPIAALVIGIFAGPFVADYLDFIPNPADSVIGDLESTIDQKDQTIRRLRGIVESGGPEVTPEELDNLISQVEQRQEELAQLEGELSNLQGQVADAEEELQIIETDIESKNEQYVQAEDLLEELQNQTAITRARHEGLLAEVDRLTEAVGELEQANQRRQATKEALVAATDLLIIQIESGIRLTPPEFSRSQRLEQARSLRDKAEQAGWVTPSLLSEYTQIYEKEMDIAQTRKYFFAKLPVHDELGNLQTKWAECLMNGNWSVYWRTIDGQHVGTYEQVQDSNPPEYEFREQLPPDVKMYVSGIVTASRVEDFDEKLKILQAKQEIYEPRSEMQQVFDSL